MGEVAGGLSVDQVMALISQNATLSFVGGATPMLVADLITNFPPSATYLNKYARVTDLWGSVDDIMRCRFDGINYRWVPQRESFNGTSAATSGTITIIPLVTPPTIRLTATLLGNLNIATSATNAYLGQRQRIKMDGVLGVFAATITGLIGSNLTLLGGGVQTIEYGPTGWFSSN